MAHWVEWFNDCNVCAFDMPSVFLRRPLSVCSERGQMFSDFVSSENCENTTTDQTADTFLHPEPTTCFYGCDFPLHRKVSRRKTRREILFFSVTNFYIPSIFILFYFSNIFVWAHVSTPLRFSSPPADSALFVFFTDSTRPPVCARRSLPSFSLIASTLFHLACVYSFLASISRLVSPLSYLQLCKYRGMTSSLRKREEFRFLGHFFSLLIIPWRTRTKTCSTTDCFSHFFFFLSMKLTYDAVIFKK